MNSPITDPFLGFMRRVFFNNRLPNVVDAIFIATWTLQHVIGLNARGINGTLQMAAIKKNEQGRYHATLLSEAELTEHIGNIKSAEMHLAKYKDILRGDENIEEIPDPDED